MIKYLKQYKVHAAVAVVACYALFSDYSNRANHAELEQQVTQLLKTQININKGLQNRVSELEKANNINAEYLLELAAIIYEQFPNSDIVKRLERAIERGGKR